MSVDRLTREAVGAVDPARMVDDVLGLSHQVEDALWRVEAARVPASEAAAGLLVCGMGGSAIGGDLAAAILGDRAGRPVRVVRGYGVEPWTGAGTLVLCSSYSGETEETLAGFEAAGRAGATRVALTTGGRLAEAARAEGVPVIGVPSGMQPRAAVAYMTVAALECAAAAGAAPSVRSELEGAVTPLAALGSEWGPEGPADAQAKLLAAALRAGLPVIVGAEATAPVARRWRTQINENAKRMAVDLDLPEADHNAICGLAGDGPPSHLVLLEDPDQHPRVRARFEPTVAAVGGPAERVAGRGATRTERILSLVLLGDLVSVYLAVLAGVDPTPVESIDRLKAALG